jgi:hypothetical protein
VCLKCDTEMRRYICEEFVVWLSWLMHPYANKILSYRGQEFHKLKLMDLVRMELSKHPNFQVQISGE